MGQVAPHEIRQRILKLTVTGMIYAMQSGCTTRDSSENTETITADILDYMAPGCTTRDSSENTETLGDFILYQGHIGLHHTRFVREY